MSTFTGGTDSGLTVIIYHKKEEAYYAPAALDGAKWSTQRRGAPGKFVFSVIWDETLKMENGDTVDAMWNGVQFFHGYIFELKKQRNQGWQVLAYDQIRYLKNKDTFSYIGKTATEVLRELAEDYELQIGELADTKYVIPQRLEQNTSILDMILNALDITMIQTRTLYVLYDDCGKLTLKNLEDMQTNILIDAETAQDWDYAVSIDKQTYNLVKLIVDEEGNGQKAVYAPASSAEYAESPERKQWGVLQYFESINPKGLTINAQQLAEQYLAAYNRPTRTMSIKGAAGDLSVRGGSLLWLNISMADDAPAAVNTTSPEAAEARLIIAEKVTHTFTNKCDMMDIEVRGDEIQK